MRFRQGDVLISKVKKCEGKKKADLVLAYGEVTGHRHQLVCEKDEATLYEESGTLYLHIEADEATLFHGSTEQIARQQTGAAFDFVKEDCHAPITLPKGDYEIKIQREYEPEGWRYVAD
jgi:hypothetical protein